MPTEAKIELVIAFLLAVAIVVYACLTAALGRCWAALAQRVARPRRPVWHLPPWRPHWRRPWPRP